MDVKQFVRGYYNAILDPHEVKNYVHANAVLQWYSLRGYIEINRDEFIGLAQQLVLKYHSSRFEVSHIITEGNQVSVRYAHHVKTLDNPDVETVVSHTTAIWELKDERLYRGYIMTKSDN